MEGWQSWAEEVWMERVVTLEPSTSNVQRYASGDQCLNGGALGLVSTSNVQVFKYAPSAER
jgi:hypothetical protein